MIPTDDKIEPVKSRYAAALHNLVGLKIVMASHAASLRGFIFVPADASDAAPWVLHIQCPWRIESGDAILTGSEDWYEPVNPKAHVADDWNPDWDPSKGLAYKRLDFVAFSRIQA